MIKIHFLNVGHGDYNVPRKKDHIYKNNPKEIWQGYHPIYHPEIEKDLGNYKKLSNRLLFSSKSRKK